MDDHDDLTWSSKGASEDYEFPSVNYKNLTFLAKQHGKHYKDSFNQLEIQNTALPCKSHAERNKNYYKKLTDNIKALETMIIFLKMKLSKTKGINLQLYHQRCEWEQKLHSLRFTLKEMEEMRKNDSIAFEQIKEKLTREIEQHRKEVAIKEELEHRLRAQNVELGTLRNNLENCQRLEHERDLLNKEIVRLRLKVERMKMNNEEIDKKHLRDLEIIKDKTDDLQNAVKLSEERLMKVTAQYSGQLNILRDENKVLQAKLKEAKENQEKLEVELQSLRLGLADANHERHQSQVSQRDLAFIVRRTKEEWSGTLEYMNSRAETLFQQLCDAEEKFSCLQAEFCHMKDALREKTFALEGAQRDLMEAQFEKQNIQLKYQSEQRTVSMYIVKQESLEQRLSGLQCKTMSLQQQLDDVHKDSADKEKAKHTRDSPCAAVVKALEVGHEKYSLLLEDKNKKLLDECNHLKERQYQYKKEKVKREAVLRQLRQELCDTMQKLSRSETLLETTSRCHIHLEDETQHSMRKISQMTNQFQEVEDQLKEEGHHAEKMLDQWKKIKMANSKLKLTVKDQAEKLNQYEKDLSSASFVQKSLEDQLAETIKCKRMMEDRMQSLEKENSKMKVNFGKALDCIEKYVSSASSTGASSQGKLEHIVSAGAQMKSCIAYLESEISVTETSREEINETTFRKYKQLYLKELKIRKLSYKKLREIHQNLTEDTADLLDEKKSNRS
ncbi:ankyrin repeat domain-containing protein 26-like [Nycticebus coucang]|uniref:ankyrin repeat domain-containing protein 26-like n=1 Tax=Nycticebus coucang TaxID=9470 RepID=UPI00234DA03E|nr:ankyrin repeat domain-containing protein 26-like [Nycticebus coucang]